MDADSTIMFVVGQSRKVYFLEKSTVIKLSPALKALVAGNMVEARTGVVTWDDIDLDTFERFIQYARTGDYDSFKVVYDDPVKGVTTESDVQNARERSVASHEYGLGISRFLPSFLGLYWDVPEWTTRLMNETFANCHYCVNYTPVFLGHARTYALAERNCIEELRQLALEKIYCLLMNFRVHRARRGDVLALARYAYESTSQCAGNENLRTAVVRFLVWEAEHCLKEQEARDLMYEVLDFQEDVMAALMQRNRWQMAEIERIHKEHEERKREEWELRDVEQETV